MRHFLNAYSQLVLLQKVRSNFRSQTNNVRNLDTINHRTLADVERYIAAFGELCASHRISTYDTVLRNILVPCGSQYHVEVRFQKRFLGFFTLKTCNIGHCLHFNAATLYAVQFFKRICRIAVVTCVSVVLIDDDCHIMTSNFNYDFKFCIQNVYLRRFTLCIQCFHQPALDCAFIKAVLYGFCQFIAIE